MRGLSLQVFNATPLAWRCPSRESRHDPLGQILIDTLGDVLAPAALGALTLRFKGTVAPVGPGSINLTCMLEPETGDGSFEFHIDYGFGLPGSSPRINWSFARLGTPGAAREVVAEAMQDQTWKTASGHALTARPSQNEDLFVLHVTLLGSGQLPG